MRDYLKQTAISYYMDGTVPPTACVQPGTGSCRVFDEHEPWCSWELRFSSVPRCNRAWYRVYNKWSPEKTDERGVLRLPKIS
jgi:hypothetical protein